MTESSREDDELGPSLFLLQRSMNSIALRQLPVMSPTVGLVWARAIRIVVILGGDTDLSLAAFGQYILLYFSCLHPIYNILLSS